MAAHPETMPPSPVSPPLGRWPARALAVLCGVLVFTSFPFSTEPDSNLWPFGWFALVPLFVALDGRPRGPAFRLGWLAGFVTNFGGFWWISEVLRDFGHLPVWVAWPLTALNAAFQGLVFGLVALALAPASSGPEAPRAARPSIWRVAATFTVIEWLFPMLFPWFMGNGQYRFLPAIQVAELGGVPAVTLVMLLVNASLAHGVLAARDADRGHRLLATRNALRTVRWPLAVALSAIVYGFIRVPMVEADVAAAEKLRLGLVEANIGIFEKEAQHLNARERGLTLHRNLLKHQWMSKELADAGVDLVVWPESSYFPVTDPALKQTDHFLLAARPDGAVLGGDPAAAPDKGPPEVLAAGDGAITALATAREGAWVAALGDGRLRSPEATVTLPGGAGVRAVALVAASAGLAPERRSTPLEVVVAGAGGFVASAPWPALAPLRRLEVPSGLAAPAPSVPSGLAAPAPSVPSGLAAPAPSVPSAGVVHAAVAGDGEVWLAGASEAGGPLLWRVARGRVTAVEVAGGADGPRGTGSIGADGAGPIRALARGADGTLWAAGDGVGGGPGGAVGPAGTRSIGIVLTRGRDGGWAAVAPPDGAGDLRAVAVDGDGRVRVGGPSGLFVRDAGSWTQETREAVHALVTDARGETLALVGPSAAEALLMRLGGGQPPREVKGWPRGLVALATGAWFQGDPFPRGTRWVRPAKTPLPTLAAYDADPEAELRGTEPTDLAAVLRGFATPILFGGMTWEPTPSDAPPGSPRRRLYNTALLLDGDGRLLGAYDKVHLLAFGEYLPFGETFPALYAAIPQAGRFTPGETAGVIPFRGHRLGLMICYEDILASFTADLAEHAPNIILNVTNDAWFGRTSEPHLHLALAVFRAVENRLVLVRSTNTGVSAIVEPTGELRAQTRLDDPETLVAEVAMLPGGTPYSATGDAFAWLLVLLLAAPTLRARLRRRAEAKA